MEIQVPARYASLHAMKLTKINAESAKVHQWTAAFCTVCLCTQIKNEIYYRI
jgi:hypothetical protein